MSDSDGVVVGSVWGHRSMIDEPKRDRRRHRCSCGQKRTHVGLGDGVALMSGCEMCVRRWVRDGVTAVLVTKTLLLKEQRPYDEPMDDPA